MSVVSKISTGINSVRTYWKHPPEGRYIPFKEVVSLAAGWIRRQVYLLCRPADAAECRQHLDR